MSRSRFTSMLVLMWAVIGAGCSSRSELAKADAEAEAARAETASLRSDLDKAKAEVEALREAAAKAKAKDLDRDLKMARTIGEGFMTAVMKPNVDQLHGFCTPAERQRATLITVPQGKNSWSIDSELMGSSGREATFKGHIEWSGGRQEFVLLVILFNDSGHDRWLVDGASFGN
jgi:outer membrane murein-binding lipoprotein Lpp